MVWERVAGGPVGNGDRYEIDRHVVHLAVRASGNAHVPLRLRSYRWRLVRPDGTELVQATAKTREKIDAAVGAYLSGVSGLFEPPPS